MLRCIWNALVTLKKKIMMWKAIEAGCPCYVINVSCIGICQSMTLVLYAVLMLKVAFALISCDHATKLWELMRVIWPLPDRSVLIDTGKD